MKKAEEKYSVRFVEGGPRIPGILLGMVLFGHAFPLHVAKCYVQIINVEDQVIKELPYKGDKEGALAKKVLIEEDLSKLSINEFTEKYLSPSA